MTTFGSQNANQFFNQYGSQNRNGSAVDTAAFFQSQGYTPHNDPFYGSGYKNNATGQTVYGGAANQMAQMNYTTQPSMGGNAGSAAGGGGAPGGFMGQAAQALKGDIFAQQKAADNQYNRINAAGAGVADLANQQADQLRAGANANFQPLIDQQKAEFQSQYDKTMGEFKDRTTTDAAALSSGIQRRYAQQSKQIDMGVNPDGTLMTPAQKRDAQNNLRAQMGQEVNSSIQQVFSNYNQQRAQLNQQYGQLQDSLQSRAAQLTQQQAALNQATQLQAAQLQMSGRMQQAQYITQNPQSVVSVFSALSALANMGSAGGGAAQNLRAFTF